MNQCPTCKTLLEPGVRFCPHDGTPVTETAGVGSSATPTGQRPKAADLPLPTLVGGRYNLMELRGGGGMAKVYKAEDQTLQRIVAVKIINAELRTEAEFDARFQREARIASQLQDPHIVAVHDFGIDAALGPFLVMEYLEGQTLRERLSSGGPLPLKAALQVGGQLILALMHAHEKGIVHRDIKPDNIFLVSQSGVRMHVRVLDFGIARILRREDMGGGHTLTVPGAVLGTPRYMSPEQLAGQPLDQRSDIYSAAVVLHETITGQLPYVTGKKITEVCPDASLPLQALLDDCLKQSPQDRPGSTLEIYLRLQELGKASGVILLPPGTMDRLLATRKTPPGTAPAPTERYAGPTPPYRRRMLIGLAAAIILLGIAALAKWYVTRPEPPPGEKEGLLGLHIGDDRDKAQQEVALPHFCRWTEKKELPLGNILSQIDLGLSEEAMANVDVAWNNDKTVVVLYDGQKVKAVIVHDPHRGAATGRGAQMGSTQSLVIERYGDAELKPSTIEDKDKPKSPLTIWRFDNLGVGFEFQHKHVVGITLYPATGK